MNLAQRGAAAGRRAEGKNKSDGPNCNRLIAFDTVQPHSSSHTNLANGQVALYIVRRSTAQTLKEEENR